MIPVPAAALSKSGVPGDEAVYCLEVENRIVCVVARKSTLHPGMAAGISFRWSKSATFGATIVARAKTEKGLDLMSNPFSVLATSWLVDGPNL
jgi:hypothetical protein